MRKTPKLIGAEKQDGHSQMEIHINGNFSLIKTCKSTTTEYLLRLKAYNILFLNQICCILV